MERKSPLILGLAALTAALLPLSAQESTGAKLVEKEHIVETAGPHGGWSAAQLGQSLPIADRVRTGEDSRAAVQLSDMSVLRLDELTTLNIEPPKGGKKTAAVDLQTGAAYFFSREKSGEAEIRTPTATGALRGTQVLARVSPTGKTQITVLEGEVEMSNGQGRVSLRSGEQGEAGRGEAPHKTAVINAMNLVQWALYYPGVLDPAELHLGSPDGALAASLHAYQSGDLLGALAKYPKGHEGSSPSVRLYHAGVLLAVGRVDAAEKILHSLPSGLAGRAALEKVIAAVNFQELSGGREPATAQEWIAESYYQQSRSRLVEARAAAESATTADPSFGYGWVRLAEMEFSFGRTAEALKALDRGLALAPNNAQGYALRGFLLAAENKITAARDAFQTALDLDGALGNGWLGRGLTYIRQGQEDRGRKDLQIAATVEPNRSVLHSYLGKAFSQIGDVTAANRDLQRARELDPGDPTPWLYSAIEAKQENRYNEAVGDLEQSSALNDNRSVYRSRFLLDQDKSVRSANLAAIYRNDGLIDQSVREAVQAVNADYASASAHLFLSNSYDALRDPRELILRYETPWFSELLLSNLLSPVGGGPLSQYVSQQEYSKLFEHDGFGISSTTDYFGYGELRETASQYGTFGNFSYSLDHRYLWERGYRDNSAVTDIDTFGTFKFQLTPQDTILFKVEIRDYRSGDISNTYDPRNSALSTSSLTYHFQEDQVPGLLLFGGHHEWAPGIHTLFLFGRLENDQGVTDNAAGAPLVFRNAPGGTPLGVEGLPFNTVYNSRFEIYSGELQQIAELGPMTFIGGLRYQHGRFVTNDLIAGDTAIIPASLAKTFTAAKDFTVPFERTSAYLYDIWKATPWLSITGGLTWDKLSYPENFRADPINNQSDSLNRLSPKAGFILHPTSSTTLRGSYTEAISGASFDESIRLEPTQVAGFNQSYRSALSEDISGALAGSKYRTYGLSLEQKFPSKTYFGLEAGLIQQDVDRSFGAFDALTNQGPGEAPTSTLHQRINYQEQVLTATLNQLIGENWSLGVKAQYTRSSFHSVTPEILPVDERAMARWASDLYTTSLFALYNHPSGFFARAEANWYKQTNSGFPVVAGADPQVGDDFWQLNVLAGYRFYRNQCELSAGVLNLTDRNYRLEPLNPYFEIPRERTVVVHLRFTF